MSILWLKQLSLRAVTAACCVCASCLVFCSCTDAALQAQQEGRAPAERLSDDAEMLLGLANNILAEPGQETKNAWQFSAQINDLDLESLSIEERERIAEALFTVLEESDEFHVQSSISHSFYFLMPLNEPYIERLAGLLDVEMPVRAGDIYRALAKVYTQSPHAREVLLETAKTETGIRRNYAWSSLAFIATPDEELVELALSELERQPEEPLAAFLILQDMGDMSEAVRKDVEASLRIILNADDYEPDSRMQALRTLSTIFAEDEDRRVELLTTSAVDERLPLVVRQEALRLMRVHPRRVPVFAQAIDLDTISTEDPFWEDLYAFVKGRKPDKAVKEASANPEAYSSSQDE